MLGNVIIPLRKEWFQKEPFDSTEVAHPGKRFFIWELSRFTPTV